ncbi:5'-methylthioadenosine/adenosylhomocysteine nucleosidase [bacterium]|nr:5'-methylthioadenosine/adenosylhomocysteine nucleosidase [bacterium]
MNSKTVCIIGAMDCEVEKLKEILNNVEEIKQGILTVYKGEAYGKTVVVAKSGVGKVCGAVCTQLLIDKFNPYCIINTGVAGGLGKGMQVLDIVLAEKLVQHDFDASAIGYAKGYICNNIKPDEPTYFYADKELINKFKLAISEKMPDLRYHEGVIASGDMFVGTSEKKKELNVMFGAIAAEMEGAAIAHAATLNCVPFIIIRSLSDLADEKAGKGHAFKEREAADKSAKAIELLLQKI